MSFSFVPPLSTLDSEAYSGNAAAMDLGYR